MKKIEPIYVKLLIAVFAMWVIAMSIFISEIYHKLGGIEHSMAHKLQCTRACHK